MSAASVGATDVVPASGSAIPNPSSASSLPEAVLIHEGEEQAPAGQSGSVTIGIKPDLVNDPMLTDAEVEKMKGHFSSLFKYTNRLVARSKEKSEQLKSVMTISAEEHAQAIQNLEEQHSEGLKRLQERHVGEIQKLHDTKNKILKEQKDANQELEKKLKDADRQMVDSMKRIKALSAELQDFKDAAKLIVEMVGPVAGETEGEMTLLQHL